MKKENRFLKAFIVISLIALLTVASCCAGEVLGTGSGTKTVTDMVGRDVTLPENIDSIVTIGSVPVINSFLFAMGQGDKIDNDLSDTHAQSGKWKYQYVIEPDLKNKPRIQTGGGGSMSVNVEEVMKINPDVVFTMEGSVIKTLEGTDIPVIQLIWTNADDVKKLMGLLGEVFDEKDRAEKYLKYFDETSNRPGEVISSIPEDQRPKVLFCTFSRMTTGPKIGEWWIEKAGGNSVTKKEHALLSTGGGGQSENLEFDMEQLLSWNPDVLIVSSPEEITAVYNDTRISTLNAIKNKKVYIPPRGAHPWSHCTSEAPLMVLWTAKILYPEQFEDLDMEAETMNFYKEFFDCDITREQAADLLSGGNLLSA